MTHDSHFSDVEKQLPTKPYKRTQITEIQLFGIYQMLTVTDEEWKQSWQFIGGEGHFIK